MGQLVFQATLGGAINLSGPNTASTVTFTLPSADGTSGQAIITNGAGTLSLGNISLTSAVSGTLPTTNGGTGLTTFTSGGAVYATSTSALTTGTLPVASGGTGITSFGTGVATALGQNVTGSGGIVLGTSPTITTATFTGYTETVYTLATSGSIALNPANGTVQSCTLSGNPTFTSSIATGQSIVLMLNNGSSYTVTWPTISWCGPNGNVAPTLSAGNTLVLWNVGGTLYGASVGKYA